MVDTLKPADIYDYFEAARRTSPQLFFSRGENISVESILSEWKSALKISTWDDLISRCQGKNRESHHMSKAANLVITLVAKEFALF